MIYKKEEIEILREGGRRLSSILYAVRDAVRPGVKTGELNDLAEKLIRDGGDTPAFLGYQPSGAPGPYPATLCVSINDEIVHGIPGERVLKEGDIVGIDLGIKHNGFITDMAMTVPVGAISREAKNLISVTQESLSRAIEATKPGNTIGDIGNAIESFVRPHGYGVVRELGGHGVGKRVHEDPYIPNFGKKGTGETLLPGMVIAIEPMLNSGKKDVVLDKDGFTFKTRDNSLSAHFEHTVAITEDGVDILTQK